MQMSYAFTVKFSLWNLHLCNLFKSFLTSTSSTPSNLFILSSPCTRSLGNLLYSRSSLPVKSLLFFPMLSPTTIRRIPRLFRRLYSVQTAVSTSYDVRSPSMIRNAAIIAHVDVSRNSFYHPNVLKSPYTHPIQKMLT